MNDDEEVCHCGDLVGDHRGMSHNHSPVPMVTDHDDVFYGIQNTVYGYLGVVENTLDGELRKEYMEQIMFLIQDWDTYCAGVGVVGQPLSLDLKKKGSLPASVTQPAAPQPKPEPAVNHRREAILAQRARKAP